MAAGIVAALAYWPAATQAAAPAPFNSCNATDLPAPASSPRANTLIIDGQMTAKGEEANYDKDTSVGGMSNANTTLAYRSVVGPSRATGTPTAPVDIPVDYRSNTSQPSYMYYTGNGVHPEAPGAVAPLARSYQVQYWQGSNRPFFFTAASSDFTHATNPNSPPSTYPLVVPKCVGDAALRMTNSQGLYLHEFVTMYAARTTPTAWKWGQGMNDLNASADWATLDYWVSLAKALNKKVIWSEPAQGWLTLANDPVARSYFAKWGNTLVPMFAANFDTPTSGRWMGLARQWAASVAKTYGMPLGHSVQSWYFREQTDIPGQLASGLPSNFPAAPPWNAPNAYLLDPINVNRYAINGQYYANPLTNPMTPGFAQPSLAPTAAATQALSQYGADLGATYYQIEGTEGRYTVAGNPWGWSTYPLAHDMTWPAGTPISSASTYLQGVHSFAKNVLGAGAPAAQPPIETKPLYQLWNPSKVSHYYTTTTSSDGRPLNPDTGQPVNVCSYPETYEQNHTYCQQEGPIGYVATTPGPGRVALRAWKDRVTSTNGGYYYVRDGDPSPYFPYYWVPATTVSSSNNGIVGYVSATQQPGTGPLFGMVTRDPRNLPLGTRLDFFYTTDSAFQRNNALSNPVMPGYPYHDLGVTAWLYTAASGSLYHPTSWLYGGDNHVVETQLEIQAVQDAFLAASTEDAAQTLLNGLTPADRTRVEASMPTFSLANPGTVLPSETPPTDYSTPEQPIDPTDGGAGAAGAYTEENCPGSARSCGSYDGRAAGAYALQWWNERNSRYPSFSNDCTNFVSQAMKAGGARFMRTEGYNSPTPTEDEFLLRFRRGAGSWWSARVPIDQFGNYRFRWSRSWSVAYDSYDRLVDNGIALSANASSLKAGDVLYYQFPTGSYPNFQPAQTRWTHAAMISRVTRAGARVAQHTSDYEKPLANVIRDLTAKFGEPPNQGLWKITAVRPTKTAYDIG